MTTFTWLHLSDLHFRASEQNRWDANIVLRALLVDVCERISSDGLRPDLIVVTGDIAFSGKALEYALARQFFDDLLESTGLGKDRLFIVPGNHDADRNAISVSATAIAGSLKNRQAVNEVLADDDGRRLIMRRLNGYGDFVNGYLGGATLFNDQRYFYTKLLELEAGRIALIGLNTAWLAAGDQDRGNLALGERQVRQALEAAGEADLRIALMHHPLEWLREFDRNDCEPLLMQSCDLLLHGHMHRGSALNMLAPDAGAMVIAAGACYETREFPNSYNLVRFDTGTKQGTIHFRRYSDERGGFWTKDVMTYRNVDDGMYRFGLSTGAETPPREKEPKADSSSFGSAMLTGNGAIARENGAVAAGSGGVAVGGNVMGSITINTITPRETPKPAPPDSIERARLRYLKRLCQRCNVLPLAAMGGEQDTGQDVSLDQVYIALDTLTRITVRDNETKPQAIQLDREEEKPLSALDAATQSPRLVLLGDPGSGKSTFVRQLAARLAAVCLGETEPLSGWGNCQLPLLITLRDLSPRLSALSLDGLSDGKQQQLLADAVHQQWRADLDLLGAGDLTNRLEDILNEGSVILILDGLDEVPAGIRLLVRRAVGAVLRAYPNLLRVIVTCRIRSYTGAAVLRDFTTHTLAPFDEKKIKNFIAAWYNAQVCLNRLESGRAGERSRDLIQAALAAPLREMSSNPMLLTTMAIIHQREVGLPRERVRLYAQAVQVLINRWQKHKGLTISSELGGILNDSLKMRAVLERLGYEAHRIQSMRGSEADLSRGDILALLEAPEYLGGVTLASAFLDYCDQRAGLLIGRGGDDEGHKPRTYTFPHRTFQEYLAGCHMVRGRTREIIPEYRARAGEGDFWALPAQLGSEELLYNKSRPGDALDLAYALCPDREARGESEWREVLWAGQIIAMLGIDAVSRDLENAGGASTYLERLLGRLVQILEQARLAAIERAEAGRVLARLGDPRPGVGLRPDGLPDITWCDVVAGQFIMGSAKELAKYDDETPQRRVELPAYQISRYPVTNAQYAAFVRDGGYTQKWRGCWSEDGWKWKGERTAPEAYGGVFDLSNHPVVGVTWYEAVAFCAWLSEQLRKSRDIGPDQVVRLPRESEWEKAARGTDGRIYPWGEEINPNRANFGAAGINTTSAVGCFPDGASTYDVLDMSGNVWEWCATRWQESYEGYRDELGFEGNDTRALRGGSYFHDGSYLRCAARNRFNPDYRYDDFGFRIVLSPI